MGGAALEKTQGWGRCFFSLAHSTEEVFTTPNYRKVNGTVHSALPRRVLKLLVYLQRRQVVDYGAEQRAKTFLASIVSQKGGKYLGESIILSLRTRPSQSGILFYDTLYDENASCHCLLGMGFPGEGATRDDPR